MLLTPHPLQICDLPKAKLHLWHFKAYYVLLFILPGKHGNLIPTTISFTVHLDNKSQLKQEDSCFYSPRLNQNSTPTSKPQHIACTWHMDVWFFLSMSLSSISRPFLVHHYIPSGKQIDLQTHSWGQNEYTYIFFIFLWIEQKNARHRIREILLHILKRIFGSLDNDIPFKSISIYFMLQQKKSLDNLAYGCAINKLEKIKNFKYIYIAIYVYVDMYTYIDSLD